jgi:hypothetical protein
MDNNIQEVFGLMREGNKNAFLSLNIFLNTLMNNQGEITRMYRYYRVHDSSDQDEINSKIKLKVIENILFTEKLNKIEEKINLKWYLKKMAYILIKEHFRIITERRRELSDQVDRERMRGETNIGNSPEDIRDNYEREEQEIEYMSDPIYENIDTAEVDWEIEYSRFFEEVLTKLPSEKCRDLFQLLFQELGPDQIINEMIALGYSVQDRNSLSTAKHSCKETLKSKVQKHNKYSDWQNIFNNLFGGPSDLVVE